MTTPVRDPQSILKERARRLARPVKAAEHSHSAIEVLSFVVGREKFAVESRFVIAVFQLAELVPLPGARAPVAGLTRWRGDIITVVDLRHAVGRAANALDDLGRVIVIGEEVSEIGLLADAIEGMSAVEAQNLHKLDGEGDESGIVRGLTPAGVQLLDARRLIDAQMSTSAS